MGIRSGTAVRDKGKERADEILEAALSVLLSEGYASLSLRRVSSVANINLGHVQYYFRTKQDLLRAMLEHWVTRFRAEVNRRLDADAPPLDRLMTMLTLSLKDMRTPEGSVMMWEIWALAPRDAFVEDLMDRFYIELRSRYRALILKITPGISKKDAGLRAAALSSLIEGASLYLGYGKPRRRELSGLKQEIIRTAKMIIDSP